MTTQSAEWAGGGALILAAVVAAVLTTRVLLGHAPGHRSALPGLLWLLATTALVIAVAPLLAARTVRRRQAPRDSTKGAR